MKWIKKLFCGNTEATPSNIEAHKDEIKVPVSFFFRLKTSFTLGKKSAFLVWLSKLNN